MALVLRTDMGSVSGRFVTAPGVELPERVRVGAIVERSDGGSQPYTSQSYTMPLVLDRGAFRLERVQAGSFTLSVAHPEFLTLRQAVRVTGGQHTALGDLRLWPAGSVSGRVVGEGEDEHLDSPRAMVMTSVPFGSARSARAPSLIPLLRDEREVGGSQ